MKAERAQRIIDALQIDGTTENSEQTEHDGAVRSIEMLRMRSFPRPTGRIPKDLDIWSKDFQRMRRRVRVAEPQTSGVVMSYTLKVMLFCLGLTMCIVGVSQQMGLPLTR